jgi:hypothetical protein
MKPLPVNPFSVFLSHLSKSSDVNLFFFNLLLRGGAVQFEVDEGAFTSVTRIERAVRQSEAFLGIHSLPAGIEPTSAALLKASRYLRFELDVAIRARKPGLLFVDERYGNMLPDIGGMEVHRYDFREMSEDSISSKGDLYKKAFERLSNTVMARRQLKLDHPSAAEVESWEANRVGLLLSPKSGYSKRLLDRIRAQLKASRFSYFDPDLVSVDLQMQSELRRLDFAIIDIGDPQTASLAAYLHGASLPMLRLLRIDAARQAEPLESFFGAFEVGYNKELLRWTETSDLLKGIEMRLNRVREDQILIRTPAEAEKYFRKAALREQRVFVSNSGEDEDFGVALAESLRRRFEVVFNYKSKEALTPGKLWEEELYQTIENSQVGVAVYSRAYFESDHCKKEVAKMAERADSGKLVLLGVRLERDAKLPPHLSSYQNIRGWDRKENIPELVTEIVNSFDKVAAARKGTTK